ncbi:MAG: class I SAM-dependent methyltransferase [Nitrospirae bacterium]|nr:MAG: class I SAM-dependent methyltransferase [Nitrospirota bacterium]
MSRLPDLTHHALRRHLADHLASWGLHPFTSENTYYAWQRTMLSQEEISHLNDLVRARQAAPQDPQADQAFYDLAARASILPVLYSQRYHYYLEVGPRIAPLVAQVKSLLDFGCGVGILTTWYAALFPEKRIVGVDRSQASLDAARQWAKGRGLTNLEWKPCALPAEPIVDLFDCIVSTHALFQSESDPGLPSEGWNSFHRAHDPVRQYAGEARTGIGARLDGLLSVLHPAGTLVLFEKASHLGRRVLLQRALAARDLYLAAPPCYVTYRCLDEMIEDGPLYLLSRLSPEVSYAWDEAPHTSYPQRLYRQAGVAAGWLRHRLPDRRVKIQHTVRLNSGETITCEAGSAAGWFAYGYLEASRGVRALIVGDQEAFSLICDELGVRERGSWTEAIWHAKLAEWRMVGESPEPEQMPLYENHWPVAQALWEDLPHRVVQREATHRDEDGRERHIEYGRCAQGLMYLYWANTFDQRQLVIVEQDRAELLRNYFDECLEQAT